MESMQHAEVGLAMVSRNGRLSDNWSRRIRHISYYNPHNQCSDHCRSHNSCVGAWVQDSTPLPARLPLPLQSTLSHLSRKCACTIEQASKLYQLVVCDADVVRLMHQDRQAKEPPCRTLNCTSAGLSEDTQVTPKYPGLDPIKEDEHSVPCADLHATRTMLTTTH